MNRVLSGRSHMTKAISRQKTLDLQWGNTATSILELGGGDSNRKSFTFSYWRKVGREQELFYQDTCRTHGLIFNPLYQNREFHWDFSVVFLFESGNTVVRKEPKGSFTVFRRQYIPFQTQKHNFYIRSSNEDRSH